MTAETVDIIEPWLYGQISTDSDLLSLVNGLDHISDAQSLEEMPLPYVSFALMSSRDIQGNAGRIIAVDCIYLVKATDATASWDDLISIEVRLHVLLHHENMTVTTPNGSLSCVRERIHQQTETIEGVQYRHLGATWRIRASRDI